MKPDSTRPSFFIGWDVGAWYCGTRESCDAVVILDYAGSVLGQPWCGNLRESIVACVDTCDWLRALFAKCKAQYPESSPRITMAIDAPLGFSDGFVNLITGQAYVEAAETFGMNRYLFRHTERHLFECTSKRPLSAVNDMIGSQATKGMHVVAKFASKTESVGVWTDGDCFRVIETYPAACKLADADSNALSTFAPFGVGDLTDARVCALVALLFATKRDAFDDSPPDAAIREGWIWVPRQGTIRELVTETTRPTDAP